MRIKASAVLCACAWVAAAPAAFAQTGSEHRLGQTVRRVIDRSGQVVERTLDNSGTVLNQRALGGILGLGATVLGETTNTAGQTVRRVRDTSGAVIELTLDQAGRIINSRVLNQAGG